jgi:8-oxo-dGTP pyrophosphatase MutT (NUDIX family)
VTLVGVSTIPCDEKACYFEVAKKKYWQRPKEGEDDSATKVGVACIGGRVERSESILACLRREVEEELGVRIQHEMSPQTYLIHDWQIVDVLHIAPSKKRPAPLMVILVPPRLGGPGMPDHLAIVAFRSRLRESPSLGDLYGLLRVSRDALSAFFSRDAWPLEEALAHPDLAFDLREPLPTDTILNPVLSARAFQLIVRAGYA